MSFAVPSAFLLAAVAVPIVVFYILKVRLRRVPVSTNLFWKQIYDEKPPRSIWRYLRHLLSLLVQLAMLSLLVLAAADPYFPWQLLKARRMVVVLDNSASMQAADVQPTRFQAGVEAALDLVDGLRFRDEMAVVLAGARPEVVCGMSGHAPTLRRALKQLTVSDGPTELASAIALGRQLIGEHPRGEVIVFTDGCVPRRDGVSAPDGVLQVHGEGSLPGLPGGTQRSSVPADVSGGSQAATAEDRQTGAIPVNFRIFGTRAANVGITQFQVRRSLIDPLGYEVLVHVRNAGNRPVQCRLELELAGVPVDVIPLELGPEELWTRSLEKTSLEGGDLIARLTRFEPAASNGSNSGRSGRQSPATLESATLNALSVDDTAWAVLPPRDVQHVLIVGPGNLFLQKVFEANPLVQVELRRDFPSQWPRDAIVVLHQQIPSSLPPGNVFVVDPKSDCDQWKLGENLKSPLITEQQTDSPLMRHVRLDNVLMPEARRLEFLQPPQVLAGSVSGDPLYAALKRNDGKCLVLTVNLDRGDLAFRTAFPIMVANALGWFAGTSGELRESLCTGAMTPVELDEKDLAVRGQLVLRSPDGQESPLVRHPHARAFPKGTRGGSAGEKAAVETGSAVISVGPLNACGLWSVGRSRAAPDSAPSDAAFPLTRLAVNLASDAETDIRPPEQLLSASGQEFLAAGWLARPLWFYLAAAACLLAVIEWFLYQRRVIS